MKHRLEFLHIPKEQTITIAASGGPDSQALIDWFLRHTTKSVHLLFFNHGTETSSNSQALLEAFVTNYNRREVHPFKPSGEAPVLRVGHIQDKNKPKDKSWEEHWRDERYAWFMSQKKCFPTLTGHNLDDAVETWIWSSLHGEGKIIPFRTEHIFRPLLLTTKESLKIWCDTHNVPYYIDPGNEDRKYMRSIVRHDIMPHALRVNPGIYKVVKKKILAMKNEGGDDVIRA